MTGPQINILKENNNATVTVTSNGNDYRYLITGCVASAEDIKLVFEKTLRLPSAKRAEALRAQGLIFSGYYQEI